MGDLFDYIASECGKGDLGEVFWFHAKELVATDVTGRSAKAGKKREWIEEQRRKLRCTQEILARHMKNFKDVSLVPTGYIHIDPVEEEWKKEKTVDIAIAIKMIKLTDRQKGKLVKGKYKKGPQVKYNRYKRIVLVSGDGDFCPVIDYVKERKGVEIGVVDFSNNLAHSLRRRADYIVKIPKISKIPGKKSMHEFPWKKRPMRR